MGQQDSNGYRALWESISIKIIGYLVVVLVAILFAIVGYNFANDDHHHTYNRMMVEKMQVEKASKDDLKCEGEKIRAEITALRITFQHEMDDLKRTIISGRIQTSIKEGK